MPFLCDIRFEKGEKIWQKADSNLGRSRQKDNTDICSVEYPNHTLVGKVSVTSFCQQGGLLALGVNRHSV